MRFELILIFICGLFILNGCAGSEIVAAVPEIQDFLSAHPGADVRVTLWGAEKTARSEDHLVQSCNPPLPAQDHWYIIASDDDIQIEAWVGKDSGELQCAFIRNTVDRQKKEFGAGVEGVKSSSKLFEIEGTGPLAQIQTVSYSNTTNQTNGTNPLVEYIIDNKNSGFSVISGTWSVGSGGGTAFNGDHRYNEAGTGADKVRWIPSLQQAGTYDVYARWVSGINRASNAPFTVTHSHGSDTVFLDQEQNGNVWVLLGTYVFDSGAVGHVELSDDANEYVIADAVKFNFISASTTPPPAPPAPIEYIVDNKNAGFDVLSGTWSLGTGGGQAFNGDHYFNAAGTGTERVRWTPTLQQTGTFDVYARWYATANRATDSPFTVTHSHGSKTVILDQEQNSNQWVLLGRFVFDSGMTGHVELSDDANEYVIADAVKFNFISGSTTPPPAPPAPPAPIEYIVDNKNAGFDVLSGTWLTGSGGGNAYNGDHHYHAAGSGNGVVRFTPNLQQSGTFDVFARWYAHSNRATDAPFTVTHALGSDTVFVDQEQNSNQWVLLGRYVFDEGPTGNIILSNDANEYVIADAVRFNFVSSSMTPPPAAPAPTEYIVDNKNAGFDVISGTWSVGAGGGNSYNGDHRYHAGGSGSSVVRFTPNLQQAGTFDVFARWYASTNRATNAPFRISYAGGVQTLRLNQEQNSNQWVKLGNFPFNLGTSGHVELSNDANEYVIADAVRFVVAAKVQSVNQSNVTENPGNNTN